MTLIGQSPFNINILLHLALKIYIQFLKDHCTMTPLKLFPAEAPNDTNVDEVIKKASENDAGNKSLRTCIMFIIHSFEKAYNC